MVLGKGFNNLYSRFYRVGDGNQRAAAADRPLESHGAPEDHTLSSTYVNDVNVTSVDRPSMAKLRFLQHPCCKLLIITIVSGVITGSWSMLVDWCLFFKGWESNGRVRMFSLWVYC